MNLVCIHDILKNLKSRQILFHAVTVYSIYNVREAFALGIMSLTLDMYYRSQ